MKNTIRLVKQDEIDKIIQYFNKKDDKGLLVELQGKELRTWQEYSVEIGEKFKFPDMYRNPPREHGVDAYLDWIRDLSWFGEIEEFAIIIYDYSQFLRTEHDNVRECNYCKYIINKEMIVESFVNVVLPFWEHDVERCVVGGKTKPFNVYLVD